MGKIRDYIENNILDKLWKPLQKWLKVCIAIILVLILLVIFVPFLFPKYDEWKVNVENRFGCKKQIQSDSIIIIDSVFNVRSDTISMLKDITIKQDTTIRQPKIIIKEDTLRKKELKTIQIKGEGIATDFTEEEAREQALKKAKADLFGKFPKEKEAIVNRYTETIKDISERTSSGMWKVHIVLSVNESYIK